MSKLSGATLQKLRAAVSPTEPDQDFADDKLDEMDAVDALVEVGEALGDAWRDPQESPVRRRVAALVSFHNALPFDGILTGVAVNQPGVIAVGIEAAQAEGAVELVGYLKEIAGCIPAELVSLEDVEQRLSYYDSDAGQRLASRLQHLAGRYYDDGHSTRLMKVCLQRVLRQPTEFVSDDNG
jgi:hypothetical protein